MQEKQPQINDILEHVTFDNGYPVGDIDFDPELNFLTYQNKVLAFGTIPSTFNVIHPPETLTDLPEGRQKFKYNAKGVGLRVTNEPASLIQPIRNGSQPLVSALEISGLTLRQILDARRAGKAAHIGAYARHLSLTVQSKLQGDEKAVQRVERQYGQSPAVRLSVPPSWRDEQKLRGIHHAVDNPEMLLLRSRRYSVRRVGQVSLRGITSRD